MACDAKLKRLLKRGMKGRDVLGVKYGLRQAGYKSGIVLNQRFGLALYLNVRRFQKAKGLPVSGKVDQGTFNALRSHIPAYGCWLIKHQVVKPVSKAHVACETALYASSKEPYIHYTQSALRMQGVREKIKPPAFPRWEDCSSFVTWCFWVAGKADPNGRSYDGYGFTGTLVQNGRVVSTPLPGDLVFYGGSAATPSHVAIFIGNGNVVSHGSESGPRVLPIRYRSDVNHIRRYA